MMIGKENVSANLGLLSYLPIANYDYTLIFTCLDSDTSHQERYQYADCSPSLHAEWTANTLQLLRLAARSNLPPEVKCPPSYSRTRLCSQIMGLGMRLTR